MNIKYKYNNYTSYKTLAKGDFFICNGSLYLKVANSALKFSAFNCETHELTTIDPETKVRHIRILLQEV